eukprot:356289-Pyramimonas_sp.AAC.1
MRPGNVIWHYHPRNAVLRGPIGSSTEAPSGTVRVRPGNPIWHFQSLSRALRMGSFTEADIHNYGTHNCITACR